MPTRLQTLPLSTSYSLTHPFLAFTIANTPRPLSLSFSTATLNLPTFTELLLFLGRNRAFPFIFLHSLVLLSSSIGIAQKSRGLQRRLFSTWLPFSANLVIICPLYYGIERKTMHYSKLIQGSPSNGTFTWINPYKYKNPYITSMTVLFRPKEFQAVFNNVDTTNVITNSNDETVTIPPGYYTLSEIIALLNTMTDTLFSISTNASSYGCIWIQSPHTIDFTDAPDIGEILGLDGRTIILPASFYGSNVIDITRNRQVIQVYSTIVRSSDLKLPRPTRTTTCSPR